MYSIKERRLGAHEKRGSQRDVALGMGTDTIRKYKSTTGTGGKQTPIEGSESGSQLLSKQLLTQKSLVNLH